MHFFNLNCRDRNYNIHNNLIIINDNIGLKALVLRGKKILLHNHIEAWIFKEYLTLKDRCKYLMGAKHFLKESSSFPLKLLGLF